MLSVPRRSHLGKLPHLGRRRAIRLVVAHELARARIAAAALLPGLPVAAARQVLLRAFLGLAVPRGEQAHVPQRGQSLQVNHRLGATQMAASMAISRTWPAAQTMGQIGALNAESFCKRVLSCANMVITDGNTVLNDPETIKLTILRMNREFMEFMRATYNAQARQKFKTTVVGPDGKVK
eukprot:5372460-Prymnesium_polylepis.1